MLQVLDENHPDHFALLPDNDGDIKETRALIELGLTRGYSKYRDTLKILAERRQKPRDVGESTYAKPEEPNNG